MKLQGRVLLIFILIFSVIVVSACITINSGNNAARNASEEKTEEQKDASDSSEVKEEAISSDEDEDIPSGKVENNISSDYNTSADEDITEADRKDTVGECTKMSDLDQYGLNERIKELINDSAAYNTDDYANGISVTGDIYILNERFREEIIGGISIGDSFTRILSILGKPGWETDDILIYRSLDYYIMFYGNQSADYVAVMKAPDTNYNKDILGAIIRTLNSEEYNSLDESITLIDPDGTFFDDSGYINGGGYYASTGRGIVILDFDEKYIEVYNNFDGNIYRPNSTNPRYPVRFIDRDLTIDIMLNDLNRYLEIEELFRNEGVASPDGSLMAVFEWVYSMDQHFIVRTLDYSIQDRYIYATTTSKFYWLTNSHLVYIDTYNEVPYALDVNFSQPSPINILYEAGIIEDRDVDSGKYKFEIKGVENNVITLLDVKNNKSHKIEVLQEKNGGIKFIKMTE